MTFTKKCFCAGKEVSFDAHFGFDTSVDAVFCPECVDRAPNEAFIVQVSDPTEMVGFYAVNPNQAVLEEVDATFEDTSWYYERMWGLRKLALTGAKSAFAGMVRPSEMDTSSLSGPDAIIMEEEMPTHLPKKIQAGPSESPRPMSK